MSIDAVIAAFLARPEVQDAERLLLAYSGGVDSEVLLTALNQALESEQKPQLIAVHINHQLQDAAEDFVLHCERRTTELHIPFQLIKVDAKASGGESPEAVARNKRYEALAGVMNPGDILLTAQHQDDQAETLLLQLLRGSGLAGLVGMPSMKAFSDGYHARPFLKVSRSEIESYAREHQLGWVEDPTNQTTEIPRNFLRHKALPLFEEAFSEPHKSLAQSAEHLQIEFELMRQLLYEKLQLVLTSNAFEPWLGKALSIELLSGLSKSLQEALLRHWCASRELPRPSLEQLERIFSEVINASEDAQPQIKIGELLLIRSGKELYLVREGLLNPEGYSINLNPKEVIEQSIELPGTGMNLKLSQSEGRGLFLSESGSYFVRTRIEGDKAHPNERGHSRALSKLFQEYALPVCLRDHWPIIADVRTNAIIAVPGLFIAKGYAAQEGEQGLSFEFVEAC